LILLGVPALGGYNYITPCRAGLSATAGLSCPIYQTTRCWICDFFSLISKIPNYSTI